MALDVPQAVVALVTVAGDGAGVQELSVSGWREGHCRWVPFREIRWRTI
jgi:hypothetical protein